MNRLNQLSRTVLRQVMAAVSRLALLTSAD